MQKSPWHFRIFPQLVCRLVKWCGILGCLIQQNHPARTDSCCLHVFSLFQSGAYSFPLRLCFTLLFFFNHCEYLLCSECPFSCSSCLLTASSSASDADMFCRSFSVGNSCDVQGLLDEMSLAELRERVRIEQTSVLHVLLSWQGLGDCP